MLSGTPHEARWTRAEPLRVLPERTLHRLLQSVFGAFRLKNVHPLSGGYRNANFKIQLEQHPTPYVLRIYEHDPSLCQKEIDLLRLVAGSVPVPEILHAEPCGHEDLPPFLILQFVEGITLHDLIRSADRTAIAQAAASAGETLAAIGRFTFPKSGWLAPGPTVTAPLLEGNDPLPRFVDLCLGSMNLQARMSLELRDRTRTLIWSHVRQLAELDIHCSLVHCDFGKRNLLVRQDGGRWTLAAVLDWEFAVSASPLIDLGHLLRDECTLRPTLEPHFSDAYRRAGGTLPPHWRRVARLLDLSAVCESLTRDELREEVTRELVELICATIDDRDPQLP